MRKERVLRLISTLSNKFARRAIVAAAAITVSGLLSGCGIWNDFFNPGEPYIIDKSDKPLVVPILDTLASGLEEPNSAYSNATDIEPGDLVPDISDYRIGPGDLLNVSIFDLMGEGTGEQVRTVKVTDTGMISLLFIPPVKADGLTEHDLEQAISKAYEDARLIRSARVSVIVAEARARTFSIQGNVGGPGEYPMPRADFRMLDAMVMSRAPAVAIGVDYAYVIRKATPVTEPNNEAPTLVPPPPTETPTEPAPATQPGDLIAPPATPPSTTPAGPQGRATPPGVSVRPVATDNLAGSSASHVFKFDDVEAPTDQRIIRVPINQLRQYGELKYNIVIRPGDMIIVPDPVTGVYYMGGHILRPGVFSLTGVDVTLKQAWISSGGPDDYTIPGRSEIVRRIGANREVCVRVDLGKIMSLQQPDIYLKPNDVVYVGTNFLAPFLAALRNSFRLTYGFGFLYDQNFNVSNNNNGGF